MFRPKEILGIPTQFSYVFLHLSSLKTLKYKDLVKMHTQKLWKERPYKYLGT